MGSAYILCSVWHLHFCYYESLERNSNSYVVVFNTNEHAGSQQRLCRVCLRILR